MKFICERNFFLKVVSATDTIVKGKMTFSNFANLLVRAKQNKITISASNSDLAQIASMDGEVEKEGEITISQQRLFNLLRQIPEGKVVFHADANNLIEIKPLESKRKLHTKLLGIPADDFPEIATYPSGIKSIALDKSFFKKMIQKVSFTVATHATKYALNGILLEFKEGKINLVASDSRRLAVFSTLVPDLSKENERIILSSDLLAHLQKLFVLDGSLSFGYREGKIYFKFDEFMINANLINGEYPNYELFLPQTHEYSFSCHTNEVLRAINLATALMEGDPTHKLIFTLSKNELEVSSKVTDYGEVKEKLVVTYDKEKLRIGLNAKMITEILRQIETEEVDIFFNAVTSPLIIRERNRSEYVYVIMPIKLGDDV